MQISIEKEMEFDGGEMLTMYNMIWSLDDNVGGEKVKDILEEKEETGPIQMRPTQKIRKSPWMKKKQRHVLCLPLRLR